MPSESDRIESWSDDRLLREANDGNDEAFRQFCVRSLPSLRRYCQYQCGRYKIPSMAGDFCNESIHKALAFVTSCREGAGRPLPTVSVAWLNQIAFNCIRDWHRRERRVRFVDEFVGDLEVEVLPNDSLDDEDEKEQEQVLKFFGWLRDNDRDMLEWVLLEGQSITEAGERLSLSAEASQKAYQRALQRLKDILVEHGIAPNFADR